MARTLPARSAGPAGTPRATPSDGTRALLACGIVAGPVFLAVALLQVLTRDGFDLTRHPLSLLSTGDLGWVQIANFVVAGLLMTAFAVGVRRVVHPGRGGTWGPLLIGAFGLGLVAGGVFVTDPSQGFPPGAPAGEPAGATWHSLVHDVAAGVALDLMIVACFVFVRRFRALGQRGFAFFCAAAGVAALAISWWPAREGISVRLAVAVAVLFAWAAALAVRLRSELVRAR